ncbi:hypothetical protein ACFW5P_35840 [Streptomyces rochei]|uniref:hypothetical protein n=1 Tax=Streptomyces rochei TaxID=1928 RepID=UPI00362D1726
MSQPTPPPVPDVLSSAHAPEKSRAKGLIIWATVVVIAAITGTGVMVAQAAGDDRAQAATATSSVPAEDVATPEAEASTPEPVYATPTVDDFIMTLHTTKRQCSGNAGCTLIVEPDFAYIGAGDTDPVAWWDVTYEIRGDKSGPITATAELYPESMSFSPTMVKTASSDTKVTVKMTDIVRGVY